MVVYVACIITTIYYTYYGHTHLLTNYEKKITYLIQFIDDMIIICDEYNNPNA